MSWTDDIRCLHCDGKLPLYRKLTHGQFCSSAHRKAYWQEQERLVVERLEQTHNALHAYRPPGAVAAILGRPEPQREPIPPDPAGLVREQLPTKPGKYPEMVTADPIAYEMGPRPYTLFELQVEGLREPIPTEPLPIFAAESFNSTASFTVIATAATPEAFEALAAMRPYFPDFTIAPAETEELREALDIQIPDLGILTTLSRPAVRENFVKAMEAEPILVGLSVRVPVETRQEEAELAVAPLAGLAIGSIPLVQGTWIDHLAPIAVEASAAPASTLTLQANTPELPAASGLRYQVAVSQPGAVSTEPQQVAFSSVPGILLPKPSEKADAIHPGLNDLTLPIAAGRRDPVLVSQPGPVNTEPQQVAFSNVPSVLLPQRPAMPAATQSGVQGRPETTRSVTPKIRIPNPSGLVSMAPGASDTKLAAQSIPVPQAPLLIPQPPRTEPSIPTSKLEPLDAKPITDMLMPAPEEQAPEPTQAPIEDEAIKDEAVKLDGPRPDGIPRPPLRKTYPWTPATDFLRNAPRDLKMLVFAIPLLLGLALHPSLPKVKVSAPASTAGIERHVENAVNTQLVTFRQSMLDRAAVALDEDFRSGLDDWVSRNDATAAWSFDATGFVQPGPLALYRPSMGLTDYQLQFLGMIDKKAMSWVVRAADFQNYYVVKLVVLKGGPLPTIGVTRYAVINGKPEARADSIAPVDARADMLYRVRLDVHGDMFVLVVQGQVIDSWSEPRLQHGGVGFFSARGESSRVRWVQVTHQYDMLGRLCAYLAPYNNSTSNGSFQP